MTGTPGAGEGGPETGAPVNGGPATGGPATGAALDWCHARLRAGSAGAEDPEDRATVRSMPIVLAGSGVSRWVRGPTALLTILLGCGVAARA